ncbi:Uma2 family endonuclease [Polyangium aurulentum]|uniref:Uma2 family endonuclease n=1 Tax=Polyangium aurulentum TaxID=2567896 RepID=UPI0010AE7723|nr:Uma2 family endonuclease [Polyangium aurulentum]UQA62377.1 Uma2 family endonuclease [Polyangium aurulentum]
MAEMVDDRPVTFAEYLSRERTSPTKHELVNGYVYAMAGATVEHDTICSNVIQLLGNELRGRPCRVFTPDMRVRVRETELCTYPDVSVVCGKIERDADDDCAIVNPIVLVEVLSPSSESYDRGEKFAHYQRLASLREYVLIAQDERYVEHHCRNEDGSWTMREARGDETVELASIRCKLVLDEVYRDVFESPQ